MTVTTDRTSRILRSVPPPSARLALKPEGARLGLLDGAWWPRSRELMRELPGLTGVLDPHWGRITRVAVNPAHWPALPRKVPVSGHTVKVGWFAAEDPHKLLLLSYSVGRWDLLVIPPETGAEAAARLMTAATDPESSLTASALMAEEKAGRRAGARGGVKIRDAAVAAAVAMIPRK